MKLPMTPVVPAQPVVPDSKPPFVTRSLPVPPPVPLTVSVALADVTVADAASVTVALNTAPLSAACAVNE